MKVLGIETSCDETAAAVVEDGRRALSDVVATQIEIHRRWGGVVPELASRNHVVQVMPVVDEALSRAGVGPEGIDAVDRLGCDRGPREGLVDDRHHLHDVVAARELGDYPAPPPVDLDLRRDDVGEDPPAVLDHGGSRLVTGGLDREDFHGNARAI